VDLVVARINLLLCTEYEQVACLDGLDRVRAGFVDPYSLFIKQEPHKLKKIEDGLLRLISSAALVDQVITKILSLFQNEAEINTYQSLTSAPGMGLTRDGVSTVFTKVKSMERTSGQLYESDMAGWDWSFQSYEHDFCCERRIRCAGFLPGTRGHHLLRIIYLFKKDPVLAGPDGTLYQHPLGIMASGDANTGADNSAARTFAAHLAGADTSFNMGDDSVEARRLDVPLDEIKKRYYDLGHNCKFIQMCSSERFTFCSHVFEGGRAYPENLGKTLTSLLNYTGVSDQDRRERLVQFYYVYRDHPWLTEIKHFVEIEMEYVENLVDVSKDFVDPDATPYARLETGALPCLFEKQNRVPMAARCMSESYLPGGYPKTLDLRANKNAERLHGGFRDSSSAKRSVRIGRRDVQSISHDVSDTMTNKNKKASKANTQVVVYRPPKQNNKQVVVRSVAPKKSKKKPIMVPKYSLGAGLGQAAGAVGTHLGTMAGGFLSKILGMGSYRIRSNSLMDGAQVPVMHSSNEMITVRHRELVTELIGSNNFPTPNILTLGINPGLIGTFPWLSTVASSFQEYKFLGLVFEFVSDVTAFTPATGAPAGFVTLATQYRSDQGPYANRIEMTNSEYATECRSDGCMIHPVECDPLENPSRIQYVRNGSLPANSDVKTYDLGLLNISVFNPPTTGVVGQLWASYEVAFYKPAMGTDSLADVLPFYFHIKAATAPSNNQPLGGTQQILSIAGSDIINQFGTSIGAAALAANNGVAFSQPSNGVMQITMPFGSVGDYGILYTCGGIPAAGASIAGTMGVTNASFLNIIEGGHASTAPSAGLLSGNIMYFGTFSVSQAQSQTGQAIVTIGNAGTVVPTTAGADFYVFELNNAAN